MRKHYIDWLRNIAILFLFVFHSSRVFDTLQPFYVKGTADAFVFNNIVNSSYWFMPLLFMLAGMSAYWALKKYSVKAHLKERLFRLLIPLVFGVLVVVPPQGYIARLFHSGVNLNYFDFIKNYFTDNTDPSGYTGSFSFAHLWFIEYLLIITVVLLPLFVLFVKKGYTIGFLRQPALIMLPGMWIASLAALTYFGDFSIFAYGGYVFFGFILATDEKFILMLEKYRKIYLAFAAAGMAFFFIEIYTIGNQTGFSNAGIWFSLLHYCIYWVTLLAIIGYGKRYLNRESKFMTYFSRAAFPVYILHQTFLVVIAYFVVNWPVILPLQFILIAGLTFAASILSYEGIRRAKPLKFLFGVK